MLAAALAAAARTGFAQPPPAVAVSDSAGVAAPAAGAARTSAQPPPAAARDSSGATVARDAGAATGPRIPGTWMRLGETEQQMLSRAQFTPAQGARGQEVRKGEIAWFGLPSQATLTFRDELLDQAEFVVENAAPYWADYVQDQLRLAGYRARCERDEPGYRVCEWQGATRVWFELRGARMFARVSPAGAAPPAARPPAAGPPARRDTVPIHPHVFVLGRAAPAGVPAPALADSAPLVEPAIPKAASEAGVQGRVWVRALVDTSGAVAATEIVRGIAELDSAAAAVVRRCRFRPYAPEGAKVRFRIEVPVLFMVR